MSVHKVGKRLPLEQGTGAEGPVAKCALVERKRNPPQAGSIHAACPKRAHQTACARPDYQVGNKAGALKHLDNPHMRKATRSPAAKGQTPARPRLRYHSSRRCSRRRLRLSQFLIARTASARRHSTALQKRNGQPCGKKKSPPLRRQGLRRPWQA